MNLYEFAMQSGLQLAVEETGSLGTTEGHETQYWKHAYIVVWIDGKSGEYRCLGHYQSEIPSPDQVLCDLVDSMQIIAKCDTPAELIAEYGSGLAIYPELAEKQFANGKDKLRDLRRAIGDYWLAVMLNEVRL